jgi:hypothetical protein
VIVGSSPTYDFTEDDWVNGSERIFNKLSSAAEQVVVIPGTPALSFDGPSCLEDPYRISLRLTDSQRECEESLSSNVSKDNSTYLNRAAKSFENVDVLDLGDLVCPNDRCAASAESGIVVFRDHQHLTDSFVISTIPEVRVRLLDIGVRLEAD